MRVGQGFNANHITDDAIGQCKGEPSHQPASDLQFLRNTRIERRGVRHHADEANRSLDRVVEAKPAAWIVTLVVIRRSVEFETRFVAELGHAHG
jgi:hypothetical protein